MLFAKAEQALNFQIIKGNFYLLVKFALYLVCVYWSTQAFIKYQSEPAITTIKYEFDKNQQGHLFPLMTFCKSSPDYPSVFGTECGWIQYNWTCPFPQEFQDTYVGNGNCDYTIVALGPLCAYDGGDCGCDGSISQPNICNQWNEPFQQIETNETFRWKFVYSFEFLNYYIHPFLPLTYSKS